MSKYKNRKCHVCGKSYRYCPSCAADTNKPLWMIMFDCSECKTIFDTLTEYFYGRKTKDEVKADLSNINLKDFDSYEAPIAKQLHEIYDEPTIEKIDFTSKKKKFNE